MALILFAYGVNMDRAHMARLAPAARRLGRATLDGYRLSVMREGYLTIRRAPGSRVEGVLWHLSPRCRAALDIYESVATGWYRPVPLRVRGLGGGRQAIAYVGREGPSGLPLAGYLATVEAAAVDGGLSAGHQQVLGRIAKTAVRRAPHGLDRLSR